MDTRVDTTALNRLKWQCRRGLLENDLFIQRFFVHHEACITPAQVRGLHTLMEMADNDLLDLFMRRCEPDPQCNDEVRDVLQRIRSAPLQATACL